MTIPENREKPYTVQRAEWVLWAWTLWTCLFGGVESYLQVPEMEKAISEQLQGAFEIPARIMAQCIIGGYGTVAVLSAWVIIRIGAGKNWARKSLLGGIILEVLWTVFAAWPHGFMDYISTVIDFGFQGYAIYLLYTKPGSEWFARRRA